MNRRGRHFYKCRASPSGSNRRKKSKEAKMRQEKVAAKSRNIQVIILQRQWSLVETFVRNL